MPADDSVPGLIFDIGANNGADSEFYLRKGFRVVAVEPTPSLCEEIGRSLAHHIGADCLSIEQLAVDAEPGYADLHLSTHSEWSSLLRNDKNRDARAAGVVRVRCATIDGIIARHGAPYYIKIDIEGRELRALRGYGASGTIAPYLSIELNWDFADCIARLDTLGYRGFQLVRQGAAHLPPPPRPAREGRYAAAQFRDACSGVFGRELPDEWVDRAGITEIAGGVLDRIRQGGMDAGWYDIHARLELGQATSRR